MDLTINNIENKIYTIRGFQVMMDSDLAELYQVDTRILNQAVKRNLERFPQDFMFKLTEVEYRSLMSWMVTFEKTATNLKSQYVTSSSHGGKRKLPNVFTEQGVSMLSTVLRSSVAIDISISIIRAFAKMRKFLENNANIFNRLSNIEQKQITQDIKQLETDQKFEQLFKALEDKSIKPRQGIFYDGQVFDAYVFVADFVKKAKTDIILIDNYVDETVLNLLAKRNTDVAAAIYTKTISKQLKLDLNKHNSQYPEIKIFEFKDAHDRFLIIDQKELYHFGASLKDLGKKWFAFSEMHSLTSDVLSKLNS